MSFKEHTLQPNVLIVDDDPVILDLLTHLLELSHYRVRSVSDGNQALQMILQDCPDILIADSFMTGLNGLELSRRIRQLHTRKILPHYTYVLVLTPQAGRNSVVEVLESGADDFIAKDITNLVDFRGEIQARLNAARRIRKLETDLEFAAKYDSLTHLLNRISFFDAAHLLWDRSIKSKSPLAAVMMDCDLFKRVNDIHGHFAGDAVLKELAAILRSFSRSSDIICRYGGEEFCAILPGCNEQTAWDWADRIRTQCESIPIKHGDVDISITVSFGVAERQDSVQLLDHLVDHADRALLTAKTWGRNRCVSYSEIQADTPSGPGNYIQRLLGDVTAEEVMIPFPFSVHPHDLIAVVADYFLKTRFETLPVTNHNGCLIGAVSETDVIGMVGQVEHWTSPIKKMVLTNVVSYPADTPIQKIIDFLNRTAVRRVMITQNEVLVGYISRTPLLRWLRNQWAVMSGQYADIIPNMSSRETLVHDLRSAIETMKEEFAEMDTLITDNDNFDVSDRSRIVSRITQSQDILDQILKYSTKQTVEK